MIFYIFVIIILIIAFYIYGLLSEKLQLLDDLLVEFRFLYDKQINFYSNLLDKLREQ